MSISLNTQMSGMTQQTNLNLQPKISKENEILKNQIIEIGKTDPNRASMLSRKICTWDGSQKALDQLSAEGLNVSHIVVPKLLGGMQSETDDLIEAIVEDLKNDYSENLSEEDFNTVINLYKEIITAGDSEAIKNKAEEVTQNLKNSNREDLGKALNFCFSKSSEKRLFGIDDAIIGSVCAIICTGLAIYDFLNKK